jgi:hypothetical protein
MCSSLVLTRVQRGTLDGWSPSIDADLTTGTHRQIRNSVTKAAEDGVQK